MKIKNTLPTNTFSIQVEIPALEPFYTQLFTNSLSLDKNKNHYISRATIVVDPKSLYNVQTTMTVSIGTNSPNSIKSYNLTFQPGYYTLKDLLSIFNSVDPDRPIITIDRTGANSFKTVIHKYDKIGFVNDVGFLLLFNPPHDKSPNTIQQILGLYLPDRPDVNTYCTSTKLLTYNNDYTRRTAIIADRNLVGTYIFDSTGGFDTIFCTCDLIKQSNLISQNYIISTAVPYDTLLVYSTECIIPLSKFNISEINWRLTNRYNQPFICYKPIDIFLSILTQDK
jgi:hypothetical protein